MSQLGTRRDKPGDVDGHPGILATVDEVKVVVSHSERATLRVGEVFLKVDAAPGLLLAGRTRPPHQPRQPRQTRRGRRQPPPRPLGLPPLTEGRRCRQHQCPDQSRPGTGEGWGPGRGRTARPTSRRRRRRLGPELSRPLATVSRGPRQARTVRPATGRGRTACPASRRHRRPERSRRLRRRPERSRHLHRRPEPSRPDTGGDQGLARDRAVRPAKRRRRLRRLHDRSRREAGERRPVAVRTGPRWHAIRALGPLHTATCGYVAAGHGKYHQQAVSESFPCRARRAQLLNVQ
ncbi:phosphotransferase [Streptomyces hygroscopicus]|nr:phosphotransferase [Streptomyces hygroscopicus]